MSLLKHLHSNAYSRVYKYISKSRRIDYRKSYVKFIGMNMHLILLHRKQIL